MGTGRWPRIISSTSRAVSAASNTDGRRVRNDREDNPSVDNLLAMLRQNGFMIGVILLVDTKRAINDNLNAVPKAVVEHQEYGRAMILREDGSRWMTVRYSEEQDKNLEDQILHPDLLAHFV